MDSLRFSDRKYGEHVVRKINNQDLNIPIPEGSINMLTRVMEVITSSSAESIKYGPMSAMLTRASLDLSPSDEGEVLVLVENAGSALRVQVDEAREKPGLVGFRVSRDIANKIADGTLTPEDKEQLNVPVVHLLLCVVDLKLRENERIQCLRYLFVLSCHRPETFMQHGFIANTDGFQLIGLGLDEQVAWPKVKWSDTSHAQKFYYYVKLILDEAGRTFRPEVPKILKVIQLKSQVLGLYTVRIGGKEFMLMPIFTGRGNGRKTFVAVASAGERKRDKRIIKIAFCESWQLGRESGHLRKLIGAPGVVQMDDKLSVDLLDTNDDGSRTRSLLVLKTIGRPLCSCKTVLEFLEAMYDLLEVLRYLVQEKGVMHRDVSWTNILVDPEDCTEDESAETPETPETPARTGKDAPEVKEGGSMQDVDKMDNIPHEYRFISDIYNESRRRVRIALADFDHATDLDGGEEELRDAVGTPMFMANDLISPRDLHAMRFPGRYVRQIQLAALDNCDKYAFEAEKALWDSFYHDEIRSLHWIVDPDGDISPDSSFKHGAMHDAESVFYLCLLFFNRLWPRDAMVKASEERDLKRNRGLAFKRLSDKRIGEDETRAFTQVRHLPVHGFHTGERFESLYEMLDTINRYLRVPWYTVKGTGRGQRYEFHLHDFMQRLLFKEIQNLRDGGDHIALEQNPLPVDVETQFSGNEYTSGSRVLLASTLQASTSRRSNGESGVPSKHTRGGSKGGQADSSKRLRLSEVESQPPKEPAKNTEAEKEIEVVDPDSLILPVPRPETSEMPEELRTRFSLRHWDIFWCKKREKLWLVSDKMYK